MVKKLQIKSWLLMLCMVLGAGSVWADEKTETITFSTLGYANAEEVASVEGTNVTLTLAKGSNSNAPKYYTTGTGLRLYSGNTMTVESTLAGYKITKVDFTYASNSYTMGAATVDAGIYNSPTWAGSAESFTITSAATCRLQTMTITLSDATAVVPTVTIGSLKLLAGGTTTVTTNGPAVTLSTSNAEVASVSGTTVTGVAKGDATITVTWAAGTVAGVEYSGGTLDLTVSVYEVEDGVFDFTTMFLDYGSGLEASGSNEYITEDHTWVAGNVTLVTSGKYRWWSDGTLRLFAPDEGSSTMTLSVPNDKVITKIVITGANLAGVVSNVGTYDAGTWTGSSQTVVFTRESANINAKTITVEYAAAPDVAMPVSSVLTGTYCTAQTVTLTCDTESADIYYTTDGSEPDLTSSPRYTAPISVTSTTTIKAIAAKEGISSTVLSVTITIPTTTYTSIAALKTAAPTDPVILQLTNAQVYYKNGTTDLYVGDASGALDFFKAGLNYTAGTILNGSLVVTGYTVYKSLPEITGVADNQLTSTEGTLAPVVVDAVDVTLEDHVCQLIQVRGTYNEVESDKYVDELLVYNKFGKTLPDELVNDATVVMTGIVIPFNDAPELAIVSVSIPDGSVPDAPTLSLVGQTVDPAEVYFINAQSVTASVATGTVVYYTTDGSVPTTSSTAYSAPISVTSTTTIKAIAVKDGETSEVSTLTVNIYGGGSGVTGDVDGNGTVSIADVTKLVNIILGKD